MFIEFLNRSFWQHTSAQVTPGFTSKLSIRERIFRVFPRFFRYYLLLLLLLRRALKPANHFFYLAGLQGFNFFYFAAVISFLKSAAHFVVVLVLLFGAIFRAAVCVCPLYFTLLSLIWPQLCVAPASEYKSILFDSLFSVLPLLFWPSEMAIY